MPRLFLEYFNQGFPRTYSYEFIDEKADTTNDPQMHFGLLRFDGSAKPAFTAVANLIQILKDPGATFSPAKLDYKMTGALNSVHHTLLQKRDGQVLSDPVAGNFELQFADETRHQQSERSR